MKKIKSAPLHKITMTELPMIYPSGRSKLPLWGTVLAADVGGTKTELALYKVQTGKLQCIKNQRYPTSDHKSFVKAINEFQEDKSLIIDCACLGVAGTVEGDKVRGVNFAWEIDAQQLEKDLKINKIFLINDLKANAFGLSVLVKEDFKILTKGKKQEGNAAIISPGTGLGEAGLFWNGSAYNPYASEGGHCNFSPNDVPGINLLKYIKTKFEHVSWERVVSGQGIINIYEFLRNNAAEKEPKWLKEKFKNENSAIAISDAAKENTDPVCVETMQLFLKYLAIESAQLALKTNATGGIYIGGGIIPKILNLIDKKEFYKNFVNFGRMEHLLKDIPVKIVLNDKTALMGAACFAAMAIEH